MKKSSSKWMLIASASLIICLSTVQTSQAQASVSLQVFYDELQPYGSWINDNRYGYVWSPNVDAGFSPYQTNGYWVNTAYGNTWVSDYSWGWAPFHYGRWFYDDYQGWLWVPDTTWAPAWVTWRTGGGYYGWAPLMPGFGISVSVGYYNRIPNHYWNFVPCRYVMYRNVYNHCVRGPQVVNVINNTTIINNYNNYDNGNGRNGRDRSDRAYFTGPSRSEIETRNHERVPVYDVNERTRPGRTEVSRNSVSMYRPAVDNSNSDNRRALPSRISNDNRRDNAMPGDRTPSTMPRERASQSRDSRIGEVGDNGNRSISTQSQQNRLNSGNESGRSSEMMERMQRQQNATRTQNEESFGRQQRTEQMQRQAQPTEMRMPSQRSNSQNVQREVQPQQQQQRPSQMQMRQPSQRTNVERSPSMQRSSGTQSTPSRQVESRSGNSRSRVH